MRNRIYTVKPSLVEGCDCDDCRAGQHIYSLFRWTDGRWQWAATSLQTYASAEECKRKHPWGIVFGRNAVWEDGTPVVEPEPAATEQAQGNPASGGAMVPLNIEKLRQAAERLENHWGRGRE